MPRSIHRYDRAAKSQSRDMAWNTDTGYPDKAPNAEGKVNGVTDCKADEIPHNTVTRQKDKE